MIEGHGGNIYKLAEALGCKIEWPLESAPRITSQPFANAAPPEGLHENIIKKGRIPVIIDAIKRLQSQIGKDVPIIACVTGPLTIATHLWGDGFHNAFSDGNENTGNVLETACAVVTTLLRHYGEMEVDGILIRENNFPESSDALLSALNSFGTSLGNILNYYDLPSILSVDTATDDGVNFLLEYEIKGVILPVLKNIKKIKNQFVKAGKCFGVALPVESDEGTGKGNLVKTLDSSITALGDRGFFITTSGEIPWHMPVKILRDLSKRVS